MHNLIKSFQCALHGISTTWREEMNFRREIFIGIFIVGLGAYVQLSYLDWAVILACMSAVLSAEMINTAIEDLCDRVESAHDPVIGKIKDVAGGFVLVVSTFAAIIGLIVFFNYF